MCSGPALLVPKVRTYDLYLGGVPVLQGVMEGDMQVMGAIFPQLEDGALFVLDFQCVGLGDVDWLIISAWF